MKLSTEEVIQKIQREESFIATLPDESFSIHIKKYVPYICVAPHAGHNFRESLIMHTLLSEKERLYEEDPQTGFFISDMPIHIIANDSRYEYDLNRATEECIYKIAWTKKVWKKHLPAEERHLSLQKHARFYQVMDALVQKIESKFNCCLLYDIHSYNYIRHNDDNQPLFSIGTEKLDQKKFKAFYEHFRQQLSKIQLPNIVNRSTLDEIFMTRGYILEHFTKQFKNTLVLSTEIKKIYCNEETGEMFPKVTQALKENIEEAMSKSADFFIHNLDKK
jgi:N-formylglutamate amidohydrolase